VLVAEVARIDSDGDGVYDDEDECPNTPQGAKVDARGCPRDSDGDGVYDGLDQCSLTPRGAKVDAKGCPLDGDGDGVYDGLDQCPDTPRGNEVDEKGCTVVTSEKEAELLDTGTLRLENVYFDTDKATLKPESHAALDEAGEILAKWPKLRIEIAGHTDSMGDEVYNMDLSHRRAQAVRDYLTANFSLPSDMLTVKGYGETEPIGTNETAPGRARNRRVELRVLNKEVLRK
jgi:OOP family OmpA-OmpF porin